MRSCYALFVVPELMLLAATAVTQHKMLDKFGMQHLPASFKMYSKLAQSIGSVNSVETTGALGASAKSGVSQRPDEPIELPESWEDAAKRIPLLRKQFGEIAELLFCPVFARGFASYLDEMMSADVLYGSYKAGEDGSRDTFVSKWQRHVTILAEKFHAQVRIELFMVTPSDIDTATIYEPLFEKCIAAPLTKMTKN